MCGPMDRNRFQTVLVAVLGRSSSSSLLTGNNSNSSSKQQFGTHAFDRSCRYCQDIIKKVTRLNQSFNSCTTLRVYVCVWEVAKHGQAFPFCDVSFLVNRSVVNAPISCSYSVRIKCWMKNADTTAKKIPTGKPFLFHLECLVCLCDRAALWSPALSAVHIGSVLNNYNWGILLILLTVSERVQYTGHTFFVWLHPINP